MGIRAFVIAVVIVLSFGLSTAYGVDSGTGKVSILQKMKNAYNNFRNKQQAKPQAAKVEPKAVSPRLELPQAVAAKDMPKDKEVTREEMLAELKEDLSDNDEVLDVIPELRSISGQGGNAMHTYKNTPLDDLSKEDMADLYGRVRQALVKIRTDRVQKQLETIRQVNRLQGITTPPKTPSSLATPSSAPRTPAIPVSQPPRISTVPPSATRAPSTPPAAPQRR